MLISMTAFGQTKIKTPDGPYLVSISSVNRKSLEIHVLLPTSLQSFETSLRKVVASKVRRGNITIRIQKETLPSQSDLPSKKQLMQLVQDLGALAKEVGYEKTPPFSFEYLLELAQKQESLVEHEEPMRLALEGGLHEAMEKWQQMRQNEGNTTASNVEHELDQIDLCIEKIKVHGPSQVKRYQARIEEKLGQLKTLTEDDHERILREVALMADRVDIAEENARMESHIVQFKTFLHAEDVASGKTLDFLTQEMMREMNTTGSKSSLIEISQLVVKAKSSIERIREQIQNIE